MFSFKKVNLLGIFSGCQKLLFRHESTTSSGFKVTRHGYVYEENPNQVSETDRKITQDVLFKVNQQIKNNTHGRLFAVIQLGARKFKITNEDIIALNEYFPANVGERLRLEKVLLVGSSDFTLLGRPVLSKDLVRIEATVIEKTFIVPRPVYRHGRVRYKRLYWFRTPYVLFCINSIEFLNSLDTLPAIENVDNRLLASWISVLYEEAAYMKKYRMCIVNDGNQAYLTVREESGNIFSPGAKLFYCTECPWIHCKGREGKVHIKKQFWYSNVASEMKSFDEKQGMWGK